MQPRISLVTLGVRDLSRAVRFYEALGFIRAAASTDDVAFFQAGGMALGLYGWGALADDAGLPAEGSGFRGIALAHNVREKHEVAEILAEAERAGARVVKPAEDVFWGGHSGYFADPDGHLWEVAWNPFWPIADDGSLRLPEG